MTDYEALLGEIAVPRLVGTPNHARVREILKCELVARGFAVEEHAFEARPSRLLLGTPPVVQGVNLIARRPGTAPRVWLVAHYDSKGQPISMAVRLAGAMAFVLGALGLLITLGPALALLVAGGIVLSRNRVTDASPGAVDNASALVAAFIALDVVPHHIDMGVVFPDAEELGLLGARALVAERGPLLAGAAVVNLDGLDDRGRPIAVVHRRGPVADAVVHQLGAWRARWMPVVVDGIVLARAARECVTIMRGDWRTAWIVHTPGDVAERLTLTGAREVAQGVARAIGRA